MDSFPPGGKRAVGPYNALLPLDVGEGHPNGHAVWYLTACRQLPRCPNARYGLRLPPRGAVSSRYVRIRVRRCSVLVAVAGILTTAQPAFWRRRASINSTTGLTTERGTPWAGLSVGPFIQVSRRAFPEPKRTSHKGKPGEGRVAYAEESRERQPGEEGSSGDALHRGILGGSSFPARLSAALPLIAS